MESNFEGYFMNNTEQTVQQFSELDVIKLHPVLECLWQR